MPNERLSDEEIARLLELCEKATPGPWEEYFPQGQDTQWLDLVTGPNDDEVVSAPTMPNLSIVHVDYVEAQRLETEQHKTNLRFIAAARTAIEPALREIQAVRELLVRISAYLDGTDGRYSARELCEEIEGFVKGERK